MSIGNFASTSRHGSSLCTVIMYIRYTCGWTRKLLESCTAVGGHQHCLNSQTTSTSAAATYDPITSSSKSNACGLAVPGQDHISSWSKASVLMSTVHGSKTILFMQVVEFHPDQTIIETTRTPEQLELQPRDISIFATNKLGVQAQRATITPRNKAVLFRTEIAKAIIYKDRAVLFHSQ